MTRPDTPPMHQANSVYYPGALHDFACIPYFMEELGTTQFYFTDYHPEAGNQQKLTEALSPMEIVSQEALTPRHFGQESWEQFWPANPESRKYISPHHAGGQRFILKSKSGKECTLDYLCTEAVKTYEIITRHCGKLNLIVLQDHGFGGNWGYFGAPNDNHPLSPELYNAALKHGFPDYIFCTRAGEGNTEAWPNYNLIPELHLVSDMKQSDRFLWQKGN